MQKNVSGQKWIVFAFDETDNTAVTGDAAQITANLRIDGGAANAVDDTNPTELEDGYYIFDITQAESNGDLLLICPASSTSDVQVIGVPGAVYTTAPNFNALGIESDGDLTQVNQCVANTDMRGTDSAYTGTPPTAAAIVDEWESQSQADPTGFHVNVLEVNGTAQTANDNGADINSMVSKLPSKTYLAGSNNADGDIQMDEATGNYSGTVGGIAGTISTLDALDTAQDSQHSTTQSAISGLNDVSAADVNAQCDTAISDAALATAAALATVDTVADAIKVTTDKIDTAVELDGAVYRYTENALENAPTGTGGFTSGDRTTIEAILADTGTDGVIVVTNNDKTGYGLADDAITASKYDESTAFPTTSADTGSTRIARTGADSDTLETLSDQIDGVGGDATAANQTTIINAVAALNDFDPANDTVARVTLVDTTTTNTDMVSEPPTASLIRTEIDSNSTQLIAIKEKTDNLPGGVPKNVALSNFYFYMALSSDHYTGATGKTVTAEISKDGGAFASCTNSPSELSGGVYVIDITQTEMNADILKLKFTETDCDTKTITIKTDA